ncbi:uncharacterized protein LOC121201086 isoform X2 [Toxotes jaculatrix]|uniref:uncharacterized protein LOC121201086 isoform X2 n=1 Tax=Toxotes jaculatrix TaxID=941984 RepID=UPI001B3AFC79|nr:uncharacterized protein LOC121201086 isoform X2 [Toxotes jaculatrix]
MLPLTQNAMSGGKHLLLLAVFMVLARCQQKPAVSVSPILKDIFCGDFIYLNCNNASSSEVKWYFNDNELTQTNPDLTWTIAAASSFHSGNYQCEHKGQKSDKLTIKVLEYVPRATLTIMAGFPVMPHGTAVNLQLENEDGDLKGWRCWVYRRAEKRQNRIMLRLVSKSIVFQTKPLSVPETIFWCTDKAEDIRSNQVIIKTSEQDIFLEMDPLPAMIGQSLTMRCIVWGTDRISKTVFYKDNTVITNTIGSMHVITNVTESSKGEYKCNATYTHVARTAGPPYCKVSDTQKVSVHVPPVTAVLHESNYLSCSCPKCGSDASFHWYQKDTQSWVAMGHHSAHFTPSKSGTYACRAVWNSKMSLLSNSSMYKANNSNVIVGLVSFILVFLLACLVVCYLYYKRRRTTGPLYEDVGLRLKDRGDDKYETLQTGHGAQRDAEYDTIHSEATGREKKGGEYEALKKDEMKEVYHTLGKEGAAGGEGGYEALKKEGMKEGVYHTLGTEGAAGGGGGYEALKKEGMKEGVYHTLGTEGAAGGEGGYKALKKEGMKEGVYHTLGTEGAGEKEAKAEEKKTEP